MIIIELRTDRAMRRVKSGKVRSVNRVGSVIKEIKVNSTNIFRGGLNGIDDRKQYWALTKLMFGVA